MVELKNEKFCVKIDTHGAELKSVRGNGREYMWHGDPKFWNRTSPVLFPFVGAVRDDVYRYEGKEYPMSQHGFARDMEFTLLSSDAEKASFRLVSTEETKEKYPFDFELVITYELRENELTVLWNVKNTNEKRMYFSIGAHPAFLCKLDENGTIGGNYLKFDAEGERTATDFSDGLVQNTTHSVNLDEDSCFALDEPTFDNGVLIFEKDQAKRVALVDKEKKPYVTVSFDTPLFGVWAPEKKNAPFLCIEPWYGRADRADFTGEISEREYEESLEAGGSFQGSYRILFE
ncbi:MAG: aldose 1-epimerase family protein [Lachnospiraceae bacterium]|nr:aldose 1-epimerase family protein [Lachnospiraceae bacterium]